MQRQNKNILIFYGGWILLFIAGCIIIGILFWQPVFYFLIALPGSFMWFLTIKHNRQEIAKLKK